MIDPKIKFQAGKGYFVRLAASEGVVQKGAPVTASSFIISLTNNWNLIGNPFNDQTNPTIAAGNIDLTNSALVTYSYTTANGAIRTNVPLATAVADGAVQRFAYFYTGSANGSQYVATGILQGYNGYWFRAYVPRRNDADISGLQYREVAPRTCRWQSRASTRRSLVSNSTRCQGCGLL